MVQKAKSVLSGKKLSVASAGGSRVQKKVIVKTTSIKKAKPSPKKRNLKVRDIKDTARVRVVIKDNRSIPSTPLPIARKQITPAVLSPYRFPMPANAFVAKVAGAIGMLFVLIGSGLSVLNINFSNSLESNVATVNVSTDSGFYTSGVTDERPTPTIRLGSEGTLYDLVPITITVPFASDVQIILHSKSTGVNFSMGSAQKVDDTTWRKEWATQEFPNDEYILKVLVRNSFGSYNYSDDDSYVVENIDDVVTDFEQVPETPDSNDSTEAVVEPEDAIHSSDVLISLPTRNELDGTVVLTVRVWGASSVGVQAKNIKTGALYYLGHGVVKEEGVWNVTWNTNTVPDGTYEVFAKAVVSNVQRESAHRSIIVNNVTEEYSASSTVINDINEEGDEILSKYDIELSFPSSAALSGLAPLRIIVPIATWVEVYAMKTNSLTPFFLGLAKKNSDEQWTYVWQTTQSPNGEYYVYVRIKSPYGFTESERIRTRITNEIISSFTSEQENDIETLQTVSDTLIHVVDESQNAADETEHEGENFVYVQSVENFIETIDAEENTRSAIEQVLDEYRTNLIIELDALARARREGNEEVVKNIERTIEELKNSTISLLPTKIDEVGIHEHITTYLSQITHEMKDVTLKNEDILRERIGDAIHIDSDRDNVTDYDEVNLYRTNPFAADTDGDGHNDGVEVAMGYNPHDDTREALITYESPKEYGVVREDILAIHSISTLTPDSVGDRPTALITGSGLPNSFITLYIYSTPIVVTVKTSDDGSWSYLLDKELENGEHEIYVGVTDNVGKIVAKSNPLPFVKTAEAFAGGNTVRSSDKEVAQVEPSLYAQGPLFLVASVAVVALGLVLMLLGFHMTVSARREEHLLPT